MTLNLLKKKIMTLNVSWVSFSYIIFCLYSVSLIVSTVKQQNRKDNIVSH